MAEKSREIEQQRRGQVQTTDERSSQRGSGLATRREPFDIFGSSPFALMRRMQDDFDRIFSGFGLGRGFPGFTETAGRMDWIPAVDVFQRGNELVIRADVPGLSREDLSVEVGENALTISGERKFDQQEEREGVFRSERSYGSFCRVIPLPEGAVADNAKANFKDGVLEIVVPTPPQEVQRGRRIEIGQEASQRDSQKR
jgi:HSP20 family protein